MQAEGARWSDAEGRTPHASACQRTAGAVLAASQLTAFLNIYKAACKRYGCAPDKALLQDIEDKLVEFKPIEKVRVRVGEGQGGVLQRHKMAAGAQC